MSKATVTRIFIGGLIAVGAGAILTIAAVWVAIANDVFVMSGPDIVGLQGGALVWPLLAVGIVAASAMMGGMIAGVVAWIGALLNTSRVESKAWFIGLLLSGIFSLGFIGMIAYVLAGPDGTADAPVRRTAIPTQATPA